jgi:4-amino-4-deoxy-L-arabinose transferase-like glycosyltransferase
MTIRKRKDPLVWGIILIALGFIIFLSNMNVSIWDTLARLWPIVLILWGAWKFYYGLKEHREEVENIQDEQ